jgi:hypothetical protein
MNKPTPGNWKKSERVPERHAIRILAQDGSLVAEARGAGGPWADVEANAALIVAAVNACFQINPGQPQAVAEAMTEVVEAFKKIYALYDGLIATDAPLDCPEVQAVLRGRAALAKLEGKA